MRWSILLGLIGVWAVPSPAYAQESRFEFVELHMGVAVRLVLYAPDATLARRAARAAFARVAALEDKMSDYRPASEVRRLGARVGAWVPVSPELFAVLARALDIARASDGAFDPTVGPFVALWREARRTGRLPGDSALAAAHRAVGWRLVALDTARRAVRLAEPGMALDLGGIAKGYILDRALETLRSAGIDAALLEAGGDIVAGDPPPGRGGWTVRVDTAVVLRNGALATSGGSEQYVESGGRRYAHVIDPRTGLGVVADRLVSVRAPDGATADALATALLVLGAARADSLLARQPAVRVWWRGDATAVTRPP